ncbi:MAG: hypothetical protein CL555_01445 [Algoriphagus sp.]|nr:hypothetical protein [Algoriphagus sp.]
MKRSDKKSGDIASSYGKAGKKMAVQPKKGEAASKNLSVGRSSKMVQNGIYAPKPTTAAKAPAPKPQRSNWKAPSSKQTGMKRAMKVGGKGKRC